MELYYYHSVYNITIFRLRFSLELGSRKKYLLFAAWRWRGRKAWISEIYQIESYKWCWELVSHGIHKFRIYWKAISLWIFISKTLTVVFSRCTKWVVIRPHSNFDYFVKTYTLQKVFFQILGIITLLIIYVQN